MAVLGMKLQPTSHGLPLYQALAFSGVQRSAASGAAELRMRATSVVTQKVVRLLMDAPIRQPSAAAQSAGLRYQAELTCQPNEIKSPIPGFASGVRCSASPGNAGEKRHGGRERRAGAPVARTGAVWSFEGQ